MRRDPSGGEVNERTVKVFKDTRDWFMKLTHLRETAAPIVPEDELQARFREFEITLYSFVGGFFTGTRELDVILQQANAGPS